MDANFVNRLKELKTLDQVARAGGLLVVYGRRRVGKTRLLAKWLGQRGGAYSQAIESSSAMQIEQIYRDLMPQLTTAIEPKSWSELLELLRIQKKKNRTLCIDEFPYLVASDPSLPSVLQRWIDHSQPARSLIILCGSSTRMMNDLFLNRSAPLYGRAHKLLHVEPMSYAAFCRTCRLNPKHPESFTRYAMVGGIPKYWEFVERNQTALELAETLYFGFAPYLDEEPARILRDEGFSGLTALSVLEAIGRGAAKPSEIAARLGTAQTNLSRVFQQLLDVSIIERELPYGESVRTTKRTQYRICDPVLRFWFQIYSPHRTRWRDYSAEHRKSLLHLHASTLFEDYCRELLGGAARYWEGGDLEFDAVRPEGVGRESTLLVSEVKWTRLTPSERAGRLRQLEARWGRTKLCHRFPKVKFSVIDSSILQRATLSD